MAETQRLVGNNFDNRSGNDALDGQGARVEHGTSNGSLYVTPTIAVTASGPSTDGEVKPTLDDKVSFIIVMCVVFLGDTARGIFFPTLWPNVNAMGGDRITLGYCVGAFSLGRVMISPYFGNLSTKHGYRRVLMAASALIVVGALFYAVAWNPIALIMAQIVMGLGSGTLGVTRAYVADKSTKEQRTYLLAYTTAVQYTGFTCMPFVGGGLSYLLESRNIPLLGNFFVLNQFTAPALVMAVAATILLCLLSFVFQDSIPKPKKKGKPAEPSAALVASDASAAKFLMGAPSDVSLARSELTDDEWPPAEPPKMADGSSGPTGLFVDSDDEEAARLTPAHSSATQSGERLAESAAAAGASSDGYGALGHENGVDGGNGFQEIGSTEKPAAPNRCCRLPSLPDMLIYGGFLLNMSTKGTIACFETLGAEYAISHFGMTSAEAGSTFATFGSIGVVSLLSMRIICRYYNDVQIVLGGMLVMIVACLLFLPSPTGTSGLPLFLFAVFLMYSIGYPIGHTAVLGLFSKVVGAQPQGTLLGWFGSAGSLARIIFPVIAGVISQELGTSKLFLGLVTVLWATVAILFTFRRPYLQCVEITKRRSLSRTAAAAAAKSSAK